MTGPEITRRRILAGAGGAVVALSTTAPAVAEAQPRSRFGDRPVSMALHVHSCFSEGGSYADGGGGASMMAQLAIAERLGVDVLWWTDHDWRMEAYGYYDGIAFDGTNEGGGLTWLPQSDGPVGNASHAFIDRPESPADPGTALRVTATGPDSGHGGHLLFGKPGNSFYSTNITDTTLIIDVLGEQIGPDAELVVRVETSYRPETAGRPAGVYALEYRLAAEAGRSLDGPLTGVVRTPVAAGWQTLRLNLLADVAGFWPDLIAEDSGLARLRFGVRARNGATGSGCFSRLRIERTRDPLNWPVRTQRELMARLGDRYPGVTQYLAAEVSMVRHLNAFMPDFELYPYPPTGKAPVLDNSAEGTAEVVRWYQERGALVQYNHPPTDTAELVATRALGTDLIEIADGSGNFDVINDRIRLYDVAARNAIFLTATSQIDDHAGRDWRNLAHLYLTSVWAESLEINDLLSALAAGQAWWYHQDLWPDGRLDLALGRHRAMGRVQTGGGTTARLDVFAENVPADATVDLIVGRCDRIGATEPSVTRQSYPASAFHRRPVSYRLERDHYLRTEVRAADGTLLGFSNPFWLLADGVDVPPARRLG